MNIYSIVYQLIIDNDCVIVPDFGGFVANVFPAEIDFAKQEFLPPSRKIAFNESLKISDGLLVNSIAQMSNISWSEANEKLSRFVADINTQLNANQIVEFDGIGSFSRSNGVLIFKPQEIVPYNEAFALPTFNFSFLPSASKPRIEVAVIKSKSDKTKTTRKTKKVLAWSIASAAVIVGTICLSINIGLLDTLTQSDENTMYAGIACTSQNTDNHSTVIEENTFVEEVLPVEEQVVETENDENLVEAVIIEQQEISQEQVPNIEENIAVANTAENPKAYIIAGCFSDKNNADNLFAELQALGLSPEILPINNGLYKVSAKSFPNVETAHSELENLKERTGNSALWVMKM